MRLPFLFSWVFLAPQVVFGQDAVNFSTDGLQKYKDSGSGIFQYYAPTKVPGKADEFFLFGTYSWTYPLDNGKDQLVSEDIGYLVDCKSTQITKVFSAVHIDSVSRTRLPDSVERRLVQSGASRLVQVDGLESKNYRLHNELGQVVTYQDTTAFTVACGRDLTF